jgi:hypothetical protein
VLLHFLLAMVKSGASAYHAADKFDKKRKASIDDPVWCFE